MSLEINCLPNIPLIKAGDNLPKIIGDALIVGGFSLVDGDIIVLAQKIVSKAEGRLVNLATINPSQKAIDLADITEKDARLVELILSESQSVLRYRPGSIIVQHRLGFVCANAGIDHSNVKGDYGRDEDWVLLLPENPDCSADIIRSEIEKRFAKSIGVLIIDSHGRAWRLGTVGTTIGVSGVPGLVDLRGEPDIFGYRLKITQVAAADELAAAASLMMGQAGEMTPVVLVRGFPYPGRDSSMSELIRPKDKDMFR